MPEDTLAIILAGGRGRRLQPLTTYRSKPAVPFAGKYRIIDFTLANCLHSGIRKVLVLTQYCSLSLQKHLRDGWSVFNPELGEYITPVPPQMRDGADWYAGTADSITQNLFLLERSTARWVLILSGDHIYRMDYAEMLKAHKETGAGTTVACMDVPLDRASRFGVLHLAREGRIEAFEEKPAEPAPLPEDPERALVSMGLYLFDKTLLMEELRRDAADAESSHDFGRDVLPRLVVAGQAFGYRFGEARGRVSQDRYWRDVGTLDDYYEASMALLEPVAPIDLYQEDWFIHTYQGQYPPARTVPGHTGAEGVFINSMLAAGTVITGGGVNHSILFPQVQVGDGVIVEHSILFNGVEVGAEAQLRRCIIDKDVTVPAGEQIGFDKKRDADRFTVSPGGVVVIPKGYRF
jgi:glucose-1-phosphate adenylyltransferase